MIPLIGYVSSYDEDREFLEKPASFVHSLGANLVFLSHTKDSELILNNSKIIDGLILGGGLEDISPEWQNEHPHKLLGKVDPIRDYFEIQLIKECATLNMPILGICRGLQIINIAFGGSLYQDIDSQFNGELQDHKGDWKGIDDYKKRPNYHSVVISNDSRLYAITNKDQLQVNSYHHQAIRNIAPDLNVSASSEDNVIEAIEGRKHNFLLGLQWHLELLENDVSQIAILKEFINATTNYQSKKV